MSLADCDQFVLLFKTCLGYEDRIKSILFKYSYEAEYNIAKSKVDSFYKSFDFLENNHLFHKWLEVVLLFGNYLNGTSNRGGAYGFKLDTLAKLSELKSTDNKKTLFYYLVEYVGDSKNDEMFNITSDLEIISKRK